MREKFAAQLYTLRDQLQDDFPGVLRELKKMGWSGVQISGLFGFSKEEVASVLQETGLKAAGMHVGLDRLRGDLQSVVEEAEAFQTKDLVCPYVPPEMRNSESYQSIRRDLNEIANKLKEDGYRISYHNHDFEFETTIDGQSALKFMLDPTQDNQVLAEIDTYWIQKAGHDPLEFIKAYSGRMPIIHLKDMSKDEAQSFAEVGTGAIDFKPILVWGEQNGVEWYAVEQDECPGHPLDSLQTSLNHLNRMAEQLKPVLKK
ncbi:sugar phosphate isomerase/epimerase family protein [Pseudalkalibacillus sp. Hm43]|uniref:sugar phosphate isomerase/epimerase family protein n=1 Tax=Pseudalkalibacillus sp. Hm43 TaxID=3450742 RepID=UPI003F4258B8